LSGAESESIDLKGRKMTSQTINSQHINKPVLDPALYQPSLLWTVFNISYGLGLFVLFGWLNYQVAIGNQAAAVKIILMLPFTLLSAIGLYVLAALGHESLHGNLCKNAKWSFIIGLFFSSSVISYFDMGFAVRHWDHHRLTNQKSDPDLIPTAHLGNWWQRLLFSRLIFNLVYIKNVFYLALGKVDYIAEHQTPYTDRELMFFSRANILFAAFWLAVYITITIIDWRAGLFGIVLPSLVLALLAGCQSYLDHAGLGAEPFKNAYSRTSPLMTFIYFGSNYHLEHHLYPKVPTYRLYKVHRILIDAGLYDEMKPCIISGFFEAYKTLDLRYPALEAKN
jgi:beta-carotene hydroxylase